MNRIMRNIVYAGIAAGIGITGCADLKQPHYSGPFKKIIVQDTKTLGNYCAGLPRIPDYLEGNSMQKWVEISEEETCRRIGCDKSKNGEVLHRPTSIVLVPQTPSDVDMTDREYLETFVK